MAARPPSLRDCGHQKWWRTRDLLWAIRDERWVARFLFTSMHASMAPNRREAFSVKPYSSGDCAGERYVPNNLSHTGQSA